MDYSLTTTTAAAVVGMASVFDAVLTASASSLVGMYDNDNMNVVERRELDENEEDEDDEEEQNHNNTTSIGNFTDHGNGQHKESHDSNPRLLLFLFGNFAVGAIIRHAFSRTPLPYTVLLLGFGLGFGAMSNNIPKVGEYTLIASMDPHLVLHIFLPVLIFESAFAMDVHTFRRVFVQVLILAGPGLLLATFFTAVVAKYIFDYNWGWYPALMFGAIMSATDPVAVVALLKELGASKILGTLIEGESLMNDGVAIVVFVVFQKGTIGGDEEMSALEIFTFLLRVALGGPAFGWLCGRLSVLWLSYVFNDALVEITITLASAYLTFYLAETVLGLSGVLAVVALGVEINSRRTEISPEVEAFLYRFWEMSAYLANTVIFMLVGVVIAEKAFSDIEAIDWMYLLATYFAISVIRILVIWMLSPILSRIGYGLEWRTGLVMAWGGLRGAVGLALALVVAQDPNISSHEIGSKILFHVAGIVVLTLVINATTVKSLLQMLGMNEISEAKRIVMSNAVARVRLAQKMSVEILKTDRFLSDSNWQAVEKAIEIEDPYFKEIKDENENTLVAIAKRSIIEQAKGQDNEARIHMTPAEMAELAEDARIRFLKAEKTSYWKQYEDGVLGRDAVRVLTAAADQAMDVKDALVTFEDLKRYFEVPRWYAPIIERIDHLMREEIKFEIPGPSHRVLKIAYRLAIQSWFDYAIMGLVLVNMITIILELTQHEKSEQLRGANFFFTSVYVIEAIIKMMGFRRHYWRMRWNVFDFIIVLISVADLVIDETTDGDTPGFSPALLRTAKAFRILRISRILRLFKVTLPTLRNYVQSAINLRLSFGYDVGIAFVVAQEEVCKLIDHFITDEVLTNEMKRRSNKHRLDVLKTLGFIRKDYPGIAISVKTRQAIRSVLNRGRDTVHTLHEDGLLDEGDAQKLEKIVEVAIKKIAKAPSSMKEPDPEVLLRSVSWLSGMQDEVTDFIVEHAKWLTYEVEQVVVSSNEPANGVFIIVSGLVRVNSEEMSSTYTDYLGPGCVIGEMGVLVGTPVMATIITETVMQTFYLTESDLQEAMHMYPLLEEQLWRVAGMRVAYTQLMNVTPYQHWAATKLKLHCEKGKLCSYHANSVVTFADTVDAILLSGTTISSITREYLDGPALLPKSIRTVEILSEVKALIISPDGDDLSVHDEMDTVLTKQEYEYMLEAAAKQEALHKIERAEAEERKISSNSSYSNEASQRNLNLSEVLKRAEAEERKVSSLNGHSQEENSNTNLSEVVVHEKVVAQKSNQVAPL